MADPTSSSNVNPPKLRAGGRWYYTTTGCVAIPVAVTGLAIVPLTAAPDGVEYRTNINGVWSDWSDATLTDSWTATYSTHLLAGQCATIQMRGYAPEVGSYEMTGRWSSSFDSSSTAAMLQVVASIPTAPVGELVEEGVSCLGTGEYEVRIVARPTKLSSARKRIGDPLLPYSGNWSRTVNTTSEGSIRIAMVNADGSQADCCETVREIEPLRHEMELYRNGRLVWAGPIVDVMAEPDKNEVEILARDLSTWWSRRFLQQDFVSRGLDLATIFESYVKYTTSIDDYGLEIETLPTGITGDRTVEGNSVLDAMNEINELDRTGVDWAVVNRKVFVGGITIDGQNYTIPTIFKDEAFRTPPTTRKTAVGMGNDVYVKANGSIVGHYGGADPDDGVLVQLKKTEQSIEDQGSADAAAKSMWERAHEPLSYIQGDNALASSAEVDIQELIPGVLAKVDLAGGGCVPLRTSLRLERIAVNFGPGTEEVSIYMQPIGETAEDG